MNVTSSYLKSGTDTCRQPGELQLDTQLTDATTRPTVEVEPRTAITLVTILIALSVMVVWGF